MSLLFKYQRNEAVKRQFLVLILSLTINSVGFSQNRFIDSVRHQFHLAKNDTSRVLSLSDMCYFFRYTNIDSSIFYGDQSLSLAQRIKYKRGETSALNKLGLAYREKGDLPKSLELQFKALKIAEDNNYILEKANCYRRIAHVYRDLKDFSNALYFSREALRNSVLINDKRGEAIEYMNFAITYLDMKKLDSASYFAEKGVLQILYMEDLGAEVYRVLAEVQALKGNKGKALYYFAQGIRMGVQNNDNRTLSYIYANMALMYKNFNQLDSAIIVAKNGIKYGQLASYKKGILMSATLLSEVYDSTDPVGALYYYKMASAAKDSLYGAGNIQTIQSLLEKEKERESEIEKANKDYQNSLRIYALLTGISVVSIIASILLWSVSRRKKANLLLKRQKEELEGTLNQLNSTQSQLIQSEKMASLGELTAGIAHEIQNPLNFVNNFSELNGELIEELQQELKAGNIDDAISISNDIKANEAKIDHHGKRADAIVKGMLQHSRGSSGMKEPTDINALCDEYLRLAYHGLRAKDNTFNAILNTDLDKGIGQVNVIPQDIGRVILNLIMNAFYAVGEKSSNAKVVADKKYEPTVSVSTKRTSDKILITVKDNGIGIPQKVLDKIFQPFFTTKPTGQGTGLGLSLSYDIIKAHGGEIRVNTKENEGTEFAITLPA